MIGTPSQTVGPFFAVMLPWPAASGSTLLHGHLYDGRSEPVPDGLIEVWDAAGRHCDEAAAEIRKCHVAGAAVGQQLGTARHDQPLHDLDWYEAVYVIAELPAIFA